MVVWSNQAVDKITVPASVPIGGAQDGVIISGADIPPELKAINITAAIIFQRGSYPSEGLNPEAKYHFIGLTKLSYNLNTFTVGAVVDPKGGAALIAVDHIDLPYQYYSLTVPGINSPMMTAKSAQFLNMGFNLGFGDHSTAAVITTRTSAAHAGQTLLSSGWYNVTLNAGWVPLGAPGWTSGVEWKATSSGVILLRGGLNCTLASSGGSVICNLGTNNFFKTFPSTYHAFLAPWDNATSSGVCKMKVSSTGDVIIDTPLSPPPSPSNLTFSTSFYGEQ